MPFAVTLRLDAASAERVEALWDILAQRGLSSSMRRLAYVPHVTLAVCADTMPIAAATDAIRLLSGNWTASPVSCAALAVFTGAPATLFVTVAPGEALVRQQAELHAALARHVESSHYRPGGWLPHITLADDLSMQRTGAALSALLPGFSGFDAVLDHVELVRFRPVKSLWHARLAPPRPTQK